MAALERFNVTRSAAAAVDSLAVPADSPEGLVIRIQAARLEHRTVEAQRLCGLLITALQPLLLRVARRFSAEARGALSEEDLQQVAAIEALRFVDKYDHTRATTRAPFRDHVYRRALSACEEHVRLHRASVHVSDWQARGRRKIVDNGNVTQLVAARQPAEKITVDSWDVETSQKVWDPSTPESMLLAADSDAAVRRVIDTLSPFRAKLVRQAFGIGCTRKSIAAIARELRMPRRRLDDALNAALAELTPRLKEIADA